MIDAASGQANSGLGLWVLMALLFGAMYFLMIRPQQRRRRQMETMQSSMGPGDEVVTVGGLHGTVRVVEDDIVGLEIAPGVVARYARPAISRVLVKAETEEDSGADVDDDEDVIDDTADDDSNDSSAETDGVDADGDGTDKKDINSAGNRGVDRGSAD